MQRCYLCGAEIKEGMSFCPACGAHIYKRDTAEWYSPGCPVEIIEQRLIIDGNKRPHAQILFRNIASRAVEGVTVAIQCRGLNQDVLTDVKEYSYADLRALRGQTFGHDVSISLPDAQTRSYQVHISKITFSDGSTYTPCAPLHLVERPSCLTFSDRKLPSEFPKDIRDTCFAQNEDGWFCVCGSRNLPNENTCWNCGHSKKQAQMAQSLYQAAEKMSATGASEKEWEKLAYTATEAGAAALNAYAQWEAGILQRKREQEQKQKEEEILKQKRKKKRRTFFLIAIAFVVVGVVVFFAANIIEKEMLYQKAKKEVHQGNYAEASETFTKLGDYKDSATQVQNARDEESYQTGIEAFEMGWYHRAYVNLSTLSQKEYKDSADYYAKLCGELQNMAGIYVNVDDLEVIKSDIAQGKSPTEWLDVDAVSTDGLYAFPTSVSSDQIEWNEDGTINADALWKLINNSVRYLDAIHISEYSCYIYEENGVTYMNDGYNPKETDLEYNKIQIFEKVGDKGIEYSEAL